MKKLSNTIKRIIENNYRIYSGIDNLSDFLIDDETYDLIKSDYNILSEVSSGENAKVIIFEDGDDFLLGLYFSENFRRNFESDNPRKKGISGSNIYNFSVLTEEIDHLLMCSYKALNDKPVSLLELELQANISKYLIINTFLAFQQRTYPKVKDETKQAVKGLVFSTAFIEKKESINSRYKDAALYSREFIEDFEKIESRYDRITRLRKFYRYSPGKKLEKITKHI